MNLGEHTLTKIYLPERHDVQWMKHTLSQWIA